MAHGRIVLSPGDLRAVAVFSADCAERVLPIFENECPEDLRVREALTAARDFAAGGPRGNLLRSTAWAALRAAHQAPTAAVAHAARAAMSAAGSAYLHPLADAHQVHHILGASAHAALATELAADADPDVGNLHLGQSASLAGADVRAVLARYPPAPAGGGRLGRLLRRLDVELRR